MDCLLLTSSYTQTGHEIIQNCPDSGLPLQWGIHRRVQAHHGYEDDEGDVQPIHMFIPVGPGNLLFIFMNLN